MSIPYSILDLSPIPQGFTATDALNNSRDLAQHGIRVCTIAPGIFATPLLKTLPEPVQASLANGLGKGLHLI